MKVKQSLKHELIKLLKKTRAWLGPILVFILIMIAYPLTVELTNQSLADAFFPVLFILPNGYDASYGRNLPRRL